MEKLKKNPKEMPPIKRRDRDVCGNNTANVRNEANAVVSTTNLNNSNTVNSTINNINISNDNSLNNKNNGTISSPSKELNGMDTTVRQNGHQQEQELFLQAFEKPTQIYRFLRNRHVTNPIFLNRTLSYMKDRMSRNNKKRSMFKVNEILLTAEQKSNVSKSRKYLNIIYNGIFEKIKSSERCWYPGDIVIAHATLYKITKNKRKDSTSDFQEVISHRSEIVYNPQDNIDELSAISIPVQSFVQLGDQHTIYKLLFKIKFEPESFIKNRDLITGVKIKKLSLSSSVKENKKRSISTVLSENEGKRGNIGTKKWLSYGCELIVVEKNVGCIPEGDYDALLQEITTTAIKQFSPKKRTWEALVENSNIPMTSKFDAFNNYPTLKFRLIWSDTELPLKVKSKDFAKLGTIIHYNTNNNNTSSISSPLKIARTPSLSPITLNETNNNRVKNNTNAVQSTEVLLNREENVQIIYNFLYSNNTRQQTEYTQELICPWCALDSIRLCALLKHLKLCHPRFNFTYQPSVGNRACIDVTINDTYDGSYAGSPYDLAGPPGCAFARTCGPVRRTTVTNLLVCRPRRQKTSLDEFLVLDEDDLNNQRPYITGHNRLYHHTETCLPVHPKELDIDSEGESDPLWLRQKTIQMIDEFSDVNEGEKELMKLWNLHVMKHGFVGDCQLPLACEMFLDVNGIEILRKNLYRNFILHMCSLFDYGLVPQETVYKTIQKLHGILSKYFEGQETMSEQHKKQLKYWLNIGIHKQDEQKLKSPHKQLFSANIGTNVINANKLENIVFDVPSTSANDNVVLSDKKLMNPPTKRYVAVSKHSTTSHNHIVDKSLNNSNNVLIEKRAAKKSVSSAAMSISTIGNNINVIEKRMMVRKLTSNTLISTNSNSTEKTASRKSMANPIIERTFKSENTLNGEKGCSDTSFNKNEEEKLRRTNKRLAEKDIALPVNKRVRTEYISVACNSTLFLTNSDAVESATSANTSSSYSTPNISSIKRSSLSSNQIKNSIASNTPSNLTEILPRRLLTRRLHSISDKSDTVTNSLNNVNKTHSLRSRPSVNKRVKR